MEEGEEKYASHLSVGCFVSKHVRFKYIQWGGDEIRGEGEGGIEIETKEKEDHAVNTNKQNNYTQRI